MTHAKPLNSNTQPLLAAQKFDQWMNNYSSIHANHSLALLDFLTNITSRGFIYIKNYQQFSELERHLRCLYKYETTLPSSYEFGKKVLEAHPDAFGTAAPTLPEDVKILLMAQTFHQWMNEQTHNETIASYPFYNNAMLTQFLGEYGILKYIQDYDTFCALADYLKTSMLYNTTNPPCDEMAFYRTVQNDRNDYFGSKPVIIPKHIIRQQLIEEMAETTVDKVIKDVIKKTEATEASERKTMSEEDPKFVNPGRNNSGLYRPKYSLKITSPCSTDQAFIGMSPRPETPMGTIRKI